MNLPDYRRVLGSAVALVLVASACGGGDEDLLQGATTTATTAAPTIAPATTLPVTTSPVTTAPVTTAAVTTTPVTTTPTGAADCPEVLAVELRQVSPGVFTVTTTVRSVDVEGVSYADAWEVRDMDGTVLGVRVLTHPHANEQPFTRSLANVAISADVLEVEVAARDSVRGFCGIGLIVAVPHS